MKRIVIATFGSFGDVYPYIGIARELQSRGHSTVIATSEISRAHVQRAGVEFRPLRPDLTDPDLLSAISLVSDPHEDAQVLFRDILFPLIRSTYEDLASLAEDADMLITHTLMFAGPLVARKRGLPWVSCVLVPQVLWSNREPTLALSAAGHRGLLDLSPEANAEIVAAARRTTGAWLAPFEKLRIELGLSSAGHPMFEGQHSPDLVLALMSPCLADPQTDWPEQTRITGFVRFHDTAPVPAELEEFLGRGPAPVVFTLGSDSTSYASQFFQESLTAAVHLGCRAVLAGDGIGQFRESIEAAGMAGEAIALDYVPYNAVFPRARIVVHHGGIGTAAIALRAGRPMLAVPAGNDQPDNTARLVRLGVARAIARPAYTAPLAAVELSQLLTDNRYAARAEQVAFAVRCEDGAAAASDLIEERLRNKPRPRNVRGPLLGLRESGG